MSVSEVTRKGRLFAWGQGAGLGLLDESDHSVVPTPREVRAFALRNASQQKRFSAKISALVDLDSVDLMKNYPIDF